MNDSVMISKMNEFEYQLADRISGWLGKKLPKLTDNWWDDLVFQNLSTLQREQVTSKNIRELEGLDLAALLRIFDRNWYVITSSFFVNSRERRYIREMMEVRNSWAHITASDISKEKVVHDVDVIIELMGAFDAKSSEIRPMEAFKMDVEDDADIQDKAEETVVTAKASNDVAPVNTGEIQVGSIVTLNSDPSKIGAVTAISGGRYSVLIDGSIKPFYKEQIKLQVAEETTNQTAVAQVRAALTAYQINNPGSGSLYSLNSARIDFVPYQFRPALKIIKSDSPRLLVADDVGVGKTIEAGLILKEMEARSSINSVLIICPRPLVAERKWELEMKRFDENFTQLDGKTLAECIMETDRDGEWPERHRKTIIPYSLFVEDVIMGTEARSSKKHKTLGLSQLDPAPHFDLVVVDEAHNIRNANTWAYSGVELFTRNADAVVLLTATPLQNSNNDLYTLLNLIRPDVIYDKDTFDTMAEPNGYVNALLRSVRNQEDGWQEQAKEEISHILGTSWGRNVIQHSPNFEKVFELVERGNLTREEKVDAVAMIEGLHSFNNLITRTRRRDIEDFCVRHTQTVNVPFTTTQRDLYDALMDFEATALAQLHGSKSVRFMMCTIMRQAASCIYGLAPFMNDIVQRKLNQIREDGELYEYDYEMNSDEENSLFELADEIDELSRKLDEKDPKIERLYEIIEQKQKEENNRVILFSSFRHTLRYVKRHLEAKGYRVAQVDGSVPDEERYKIRERFLMDRDQSEAVDILLFSEVGCEGLDYQFCDTMINYDLPWNPMRIEQRIGRIDRRGQKSEAVRIYNMITNDTIDAVIYDRCLSKIGVFEASIGDCSEILGDISEQIFKIMFDSTLSDEERQIKIEKMADNEVMKVREMQHLEQEEKSLFGFDLSNYIQNKDVQDAENDWISPDSIQEMLETFLVDFLGDGEYIRGKSELKNMRIGGEKKQLLMDDMRKEPLANTNNATKLWNAYLKSNSPQLRITFDSVTAKDNRDVTFLTQMHPLVIQAARYESKMFPCEMGISISDDGIGKGDYEFLIYAWRYVGLRPDIKLVAICENEEVQNSILQYVRFANDYPIDGGAHSANWDLMDGRHYEKWQTAKEEYARLVKEDCSYRVDQLRQTHTKREMVLRGQMESVTDEKIIRMRKSQLEKLSRDYEAQKKELEETIQKADIHTMLLVRGVLHIE